MNELEKFELLIDKFFTDKSHDQVEAILKKYDQMKFEGPTIAEYLDSLSEVLAFPFYSYDVINPVCLPAIGSEWISGDFSFYNTIIPVENIIPTIEIISNFSTGYSNQDFYYRLAA
jgi:hypothetical protein